MVRPKGRKSVGERQQQVGLCVKSLKLDRAALEGVLLHAHPACIAEIAGSIEQLDEIAPTPEETAALIDVPADAKLDEASLFFQEASTIPDFEARVRVLRIWLPFDDMLKAGLATWERIETQYTMYSQSKALPQVGVFSFFLFLPRSH